MLYDRRETRFPTSDQGKCELFRITGKPQPLAETPDPLGAPVTSATSFRQGPDSVREPNRGVDYR